MATEKTYPYFILLALLLAGSLQLPAQVYPGDANNDGIVSNLDMLYIGYAYGAIGPIRPSAGPDFSEEAIILPWATQFPGPDSTNYAFADADGSGQIDFQDFLIVWRNYGLKRLNPQPPAFLEGIPGFDPVLRFGAPTGIPLLTEGSTIEIPIYLEGSFGDSLINANGLAFSIECNNMVFKEIKLDFANSWMVQDSAAFQFQLPNVSNPNRLDAALTRFGQDPVTGKGLIGKLRAVIEDDLIGLRELDSMEVNISIKFIKLKDGEFREIPVVGDETTIMIYDQNSIVPVDELPENQPLLVFPNPVFDQRVQIISPSPVLKIECFNIQGQIIGYQHFNKEVSVQYMLPPNTGHIIFLKIYTKSGFALKKIATE